MDLNQRRSEAQANARAAFKRAGVAEADLRSAAGTSGSKVADFLNGSTEDVAAFDLVDAGGAFSLSADEMFRGAA